MTLDLFVFTYEKEGAEMIAKWTPTRKYKQGKQITIDRLEKWADCNHIILEDLDKQETNPNEKKADYIARFPDSTEIVVEVKEITRPILMNKFGFTFKGNTNTRGAFAPADHVRNKFRKAHPQLKDSADKGIPTLLLIGCWAPFQQWAEQMDEYFLHWAIPPAMRGGGPAFDLPDSGLRLVSIAHGGQQATGTFNRSISAIGRFDGSSDNLVLYPHQNAKVPFKMPLPGIKQLPG